MSSRNALANPPSKHHYIPEFYLRWWTGSDGRLERFTRPFGAVTVRRVPPSEVGWLTNLYASPEAEPGRRQWLEQEFFRSVDNLAAKVLFKLNSPNILRLSSEEKSHWSKFIFSLLHRTPENLRAFKEGGRRILGGVLKDLASVYADHRRPDDPETYEEYVAGRKDEDDERSILSSLPHITLTPAMESFMLSRPWGFIDLSAARNELLISDSPVVRTNGMLTAHGHLAMPIAPRRLFVVAKDQKVLDKIFNTNVDNLVRDMNASTVGGARHFVAGTNRCQERFIRNRFGTESVLRLGHGTMDFDPT